MNQRRAGFRPYATRISYGVKIKLGDYPGILDFARDQIETAKRNGIEPEYTIEWDGVDPRDVSYIRHGRKSWLDWWRDRLGIKY